MAAHHRHQASLEQIMDFSPQEVPTPEKRLQAEDIFFRLTSHFEPLQSDQPYKKVTLLRATYEHLEAKDEFLQMFFIYLGREDENTHSEEDTHSHPALLKAEEIFIDEFFTRGVSRYTDFGPSYPQSMKGEVEEALEYFADYFFERCFLPLKILGNKTLQPTLAALSDNCEDVVQTPFRLSILRRDCLIRDHHRCVVSRVFDRLEAGRRVERDKDNAQDDDGQQLVYGPGQVSSAEVAHIIPNSLVSTEENQPQLNEAKKTALSILDMFAPGITHLIESPDIDRPVNAITLTKEIHRDFGNFNLYFEALESSAYPPHTYKIDSRETNMLLRPAGLPATRTLLLSPNRTIDPPSAKLLAIHRAVSIILHISAAGAYIDKVTRDTELLWAQSDGSTDLGYIVFLRLGGWLDAMAA